MQQLIEKHKIKWLVGLIWGGGILYLVSKTWEDREVLFSLLRHLSLAFTGYAVLLYMIALISVTVGWGSIVGSIEPSISTHQHYIVFLATLAARRLPGTLWYVGGRVGIYRALHVPTRNIVLASGVEMASMVLTGGWLGGYALIIGLLSPSALVIAMILWTIVPLVLLRLPALHWVLHHLFHIGGVSFDSRRVTVGMFCHLVMWASGGGMFAILARSLQMLDARAFFHLVTTWPLAGSLGLLTFFLPSTFGIPEAINTLTLVRYFPLSAAFTLSIVTRGITLLVEAVVSFGSLFLLKFYRLLP